jgi:hypothetical protein
VLQGMKRLLSGVDCMRKRKLTETWCVWLGAKRVHKAYSGQEGKGMLQYVPMGACVT